MGGHRWLVTPLFGGEGLTFHLGARLMCDTVVSLHLSIQRQLKPFQLNPGSSILAL